MNSILNRSIQPQTSPIENISIQNPEKSTFPNKIPVYTINAGTQEVIMIKFVFTAGEWYEENKLTAKSCCQMLSRGTEKFSANEIAEKLDYYGVSMQAVAGKDSAYVSFYLLNKNLSNIITYIEEIIKHPVFPENELKILMDNNKQNFVINSEKVDFIAKNQLNETLFGHEHPYGKVATLHDFSSLERDNLVDFHTKHFSSNNCSIVIAGKIKEEHTRILDTAFGKNSWNQSESIKDNKHLINSASEKKCFIEKTDAVQSAILKGMTTISKTHHDFQGLSILNTILGGYFGSRLMTNIREDKGYTYGIGSYLLSLKHSGIFIISSEVGVEVSKKAMDETNHEIKRLRTNLVPNEELELVRNYMLGQILRSFDGPFSIAGNYVSLLEFGLDLNYIHEYMHTIRNISSEELITLAQKYFIEGNMHEIIVGGKA